MGAIRTLPRLIFLSVYRVRNPWQGRIVGRKAFYTCEERGVRFLEEVVRLSSLLRCFVDISA